MTLIPSWQFHHFLRIIMYIIYFSNIKVVGEEILIMNQSDKIKFNLLSQFSKDLKEIKEESYPKTKK